MKNVEWKITFSEFKLFYKVMKNLKHNNPFHYYELLQIYGGYCSNLRNKNINDDDTIPIM